MILFGPDPQQAQIIALVRKARTQLSSPPLIEPLPFRKTVKASQVTIDVKGIYR